MTARLLVGDVRDRIREIPDGSVDLVCCSPPFLALRDYGGADRVDAEMGSEGTPAAFLDALLELTEEFRRVLTPHGSIAIELGDTYSGSGGAGGGYNEGGLRDGQAKFDGSAKRLRKGMASGEGWPLDKSLCMLPTLYPASLAYGWNMLNPATTFDRWRVRNLIVWARPNPPVGALGDKVRPATSYITVACTSAKRWFDLDAVRGPGSENTHARTAKGVTSRPNSGKAADDDKRGGNFSTLEVLHDTNGAPPLDWWEDDDPTGHATLIQPTYGYAGAHFATWPPKLATRLIEMMCPRQVCTVCGEPKRRIVERARTLDGEVVEGLAPLGDDKARRRQNGEPANWRYGSTVLSDEWTDCGHDAWRPGVTLDPFAGSGTTLAVATGCGRDAIGIELYEANARLIEERVGMFLEVA